MHDPVDDNDRYTWNAFYFNREDNRVFVPKRNRWLGFTVNFAHPVTYLLLAPLLLLLFLVTRPS